MQTKWELKSLWQVIVVLIVFSLTGPTVAYLAKPFLNFISNGGDTEWWMWLIYILISIPVYNVILLFYGFLLGQFAFFWKYEQKVLKRFRFKKNAQKE